MTCIDVSTSVGLSWLLVNQVTLDSGRGADLRWLITLPFQVLTSACPGRLEAETRLVPCCHCLQLVE